MHVYRLVACHRVADVAVPTVAAFMGRCCDCGAVIWVRHATPSQAAKICDRCATADEVEAA